jgi:hypothetical protein
MERGNMIYGALLFRDIIIILRAERRDGPERWRNKQFSARRYEDEECSTIELRKGDEEQ